MGHVLVRFRTQVVHYVLEASHRQCVLHEVLIRAVCRLHWVIVGCIHRPVHILVARCAGLPTGLAKSRQHKHYEQIP